MDAVAEIKQNLDIVNVVGGYISLKKSGRNYKAVCPFHAENTPSFMVSPELQIFKCFGCGEAGDMFNFVQRIEGIDFGATIEILAEKAGVKLEKSAVYDQDHHLKNQIFQVNDGAAKFFNHVLTKHPAGKDALDYIKNKRKLTDKTIKDFLIGYAPDSSRSLYDFLHKNSISNELMIMAGLVYKKDQNFADKFRGRIMFPFTGIDGKTVGFNGRTIFDRQPKYMNSPETLVFHKSSFIYGLDKAKLPIKKDGVFVVEGQLDTISAHQAGFSNVVAATGTALTIQQLKILSRYTTDIAFCFDSDSAGVSAIFRGIDLAESLGFNIKVAIIPKPYKDLDEMLNSGRDAITKVKEVFEKTIPAYDFFLYSILKRYDKTSPDGKKKIMDELVPRFSGIKSPVLRDHYTKQIAVELGLDEETIASMMTNAKPETKREYGQNSENPIEIISKHNYESYIISLLLKADLDTMRSIGYKVDPRDFSDENLGKILESLKKYLKKKLENFNPEDFKKKLDSSLVQPFSDLYMWEDQDTLPENLSKLLEDALDRLQKESAKRKLKALSEQIKLAEKSGDNKNLIKLTEEFSKIKNTLL